jgi:hypothetical protein
LTVRRIYDEMHRCKKCIAPPVEIALGRLLFAVGVVLSQVR